MKADRWTTVLGILTAICGLLAISTGKWIVGGIILLLSFGIFWNRGGGNINDRSIYENEVKSELEIRDIFEKIKDTDTPLGRAWIAGHKGYPGESIIFGPTRFKDCVVISKKAGKINIKHITLLDNIIRSEDDEYRFEDLINTSETAVTPRIYSIFAEFKLASVMMVRHLRELIEKWTAGDEVKAPDQMDVFSFYYHNSGEGWFRNADEEDVLRVECSYSPFITSVFNADGEEMASVRGRQTNARGEVVNSAGFDILADGKPYGEILPVKDKRSQGFLARTDAGDFKLSIFPACRRANISCNYTIEKDGELKAVIGGSPRIVFNDVDERQNDLVLSYDDDYLVLYAVLEIFIMTLNGRFLK